MKICANCFKDTDLRMRILSLKNLKKCDIHNRREYIFDTDDVFPITLDMNNYKEQYRYATTPWIVSEMKGSAEHVELAKLFRFNTISDGNASNTEVKVSIENIDPTNGTFDRLADTRIRLAIIENYTIEKNNESISGRLETLEDDGFYF